MCYISSGSAVWDSVGFTQVQPSSVFLKYMFVDEVKDHDHQSQEFIVKLWLIDDVSCNNTCSYKEFSILSILFSNEPQIQSHWVWGFLCISQFAFPSVCVCVCVCVSKRERERCLWRQRRCLDYFFDVRALGARDRQPDITLLNPKGFGYNHLKK